MSSFVRFQTSRISNYTSKPQGLFAAYWFLKESGRLSPEDLKRGSELYDWFQANVPDPPFYATGNEIRATTWWKASATGVLERARDLAGLLAQYDVDVQEVVGSDVGAVVYEDDYQVAVTS